MNIENKFQKKELLANLILVGKIVSSHGIKGAVKLLVYTENLEDVLSFSNILDAEGNRYQLTPLSKKKNPLIVNIENTDTREKSDLLIGKKLYVLRSEFPKVDKEEVYYHIDLVGLKVINQDKKTLGLVKSIENYGAGDIIIIEDKKRKLEGSYLFNKENFPTIDIKEGIIICGQLEF